MTTILGIDAAWTATQPSGVALVSSEAGRWRVTFAGSSYGHLIDRAARRVPSLRLSGSIADAAGVLAAAAQIAGAPIDLVAVDMPLSLKAIAGRRVSDDLVSKAYGARHCSTHTPSAIRPGRISDDMRAGFEECGFKLLTKDLAVPGLLEVYPHPALVELTGAARRLPYKVGKIRDYWPTESSAGRRTRLVETWRTIVESLEGWLPGLDDVLPLPQFDAPTWQMKAFEDMLDAVICAWVGICAFERTAVPFGDETSAIWIPQSELLSTGQRST
ncbi:DUF429 domain-containing protein [Rhizobium bangladeshense]|uniref:DUF429 domain-containing protein n=1 Tax=Rhizobium bangladeshense TaxID=1138189 RepID=UPI0007E574B3|nr:DUF429 domain-containing protein [Rhizobium bangladeshense]